MDISALCASPTPEGSESPLAHHSSCSPDQHWRRDHDPAHVPPDLGQHLPPPPPPPHTPSTSPAHGPHASMSASLPRFHGIGSNSTGTAAPFERHPHHSPRWQQHQQPATAMAYRSSVGSSRYTSSGMGNVIEQCEALCNTLDMFRNRDPRARSKSEIDAVSQTAGRLLASLLSLQGQTSSYAPFATEAITEVTSTHRSPVPLFQVTRQQQQQQKQQKQQQDALRSSSGGPASANTNRRRAKRSMAGRRCHSCHTTETPEWRRGPDGARTLCNACGLHYAKLVRNGSLAGVRPTAAGQQQRLPQESASEAQYSGCALAPSADDDVLPTSHQLVPFTAGSSSSSSSSDRVCGFRENAQQSLQQPIPPGEGLMRQNAVSAAGYNAGEGQEENKRTAQPR